MKKSHNIPSILQETASKHPDAAALRFVGEEIITYCHFLGRVEDLAARLISKGITKGDRIAILSHNMPQWAVAYFGITATGAIAVPLMPEFKSNEIASIITHSEAKLVFVSRQLHPNIPGELQSVILEDLDNFIAPDGAEPLTSFKIGDVATDVDDLASIIYTSGTTGDPKGVMLSHGNILFTVERSAIIQPVAPDDRFLSVLPLSHIYEFSLGLILPVMFGASVSYLHKPPTAPVLLPALAEVKPTIMLTVPLLIEKVFWKSVHPKLTSSPITKALYRTPLFRKLLHKIAGRKVYKTFGGCLKFYGIGGSKLDPRVELFLRDAGFPYAIGYGLTETSPLLAGGSPGNFQFQSTGTAMKDVELRLHNPDPVTNLGEIQARGANVMKGYYKNPELTAAVFEDENWFKTGDLGYFDKKGNLHIKGRIKNTIIGANGKNIFPEEIENVINNLKYVKESLVLESKGKLVGLVHPDYEAIEANFRQMREDAEQLRENIEMMLKDIQKQVNNQVNKFSRLQAILEQPVPFERTPSHKIKRFLYQ